MSAPSGAAVFSRQRPAAGVFDAEQRGAAQPLLAVERAAAIGRHQQGTQTAEAVCVDQPLRDQLGQRLLDLRAQQGRTFDDLVEERRAMRRDELDHLSARSMSASGR